jgi:hypothetical protein
LCLYIFSAQGLGKRSGKKRTGKAKKTASKQIIGASHF